MMMVLFKESKLQTAIHVYTCLNSFIYANWFALGFHTFHFQFSFSLYPSWCCCFPFFSPFFSYFVGFFFLFFSFSFAVCAVLSPIPFCRYYKMCNVNHNVHKWNVVATKSVCWRYDTSDDFPDSVSACRI